MPGCNEVYGRKPDSQPEQDRIVSPLGGGDVPAQTLPTRRQALWPPKPKELLRTMSTLASRAFQGM